MVQTDKSHSSADLIHAWAKVIRNNSAHKAFYKTYVKNISKTAYDPDEEVSNAKDLWVEQPNITQISTPVYEPNEDKAQQFRAGLEACLDSDVFEPGLKSATEYYVEKWLQEDALLVQINIGKIFLECTDNQKRLVGILNAIAHLGRETFHPVNELITRASLSNISVEVKECAIRVYEYWEDPALIEHLKHHELTPKWLDEYRLQVIEDFCGAA